MPRRNPPWMIRGAEIGPVYHGGKSKITLLDESRLQARDYGFYGEGFYVTTSKSYAKTYGPRVTEFEVWPDAKILVSALKPQDAPRGLAEEVLNYIYKEGIEKARARGKEKAFVEHVRSIPENILEWKNAVDRFAVGQDFDAVIHSLGEIVVKHPDILAVVTRR